MILVSGLLRPAGAPLIMPPRAAALTRPPLAPLLLPLEPALLNGSLFQPGLLRGARCSPGGAPEAGPPFLRELYLADEDGMLL